MSLKYKTGDLIRITGATPLNPKRDIDPKKMALVGEIYEILACERREFGSSWYVLRGCNEFCFKEEDLELVYESW